MSTESMTGFYREFSEKYPKTLGKLAESERESPGDGIETLDQFEVAEIMMKPRPFSERAVPLIMELRKAVSPFACLADTLPEAIRPEETVTMEIKAGDLMAARKAYLDGM